MSLYQEGLDFLKASLPNKILKSFNRMLLGAGDGTRRTETWLYSPTKTVLKTRCLRWPVPYGLEHTLCPLKCQQILNIVDLLGALEPLLTYLYYLNRGLVFSGECQYYWSKASYVNIYYASLKNIVIGKDSFWNRVLLFFLFHKRAQEKGYGHKRI